VRHLSRPPAASGQGKNLEVTIPPGVEEGTRIRLAGEGEAGGPGAPAGDLYIFLAITAHRMFQRDGANLYMRMPIPMTTAILTARSKCLPSTAAGSRSPFPKGCQKRNTASAFKGKGMSVLRSTARGDMFLEAAVESTGQPHRQAEKNCSRNSRLKATSAPTARNARRSSTRSKEFIEELARLARISRVFYAAPNTAKTSTQRDCRRSGSYFR